MAGSQRGADGSKTEEVQSLRAWPAVRVDEVSGVKS